MRKHSVKNTRINSEVLKELSRIISREIKDPRIAPMTSVVSVEVAPDLKTCKAYISVLGDKEAQESTLEGLRSAHGYIRRELARSINSVSYTHRDMSCSICTLLARGAIISMIVVLTLLPTMFLIFDKVICKTTGGMKHIDN